MKTKKLIPLALSCLLILETPFLSQAADFSRAQIPSIRTTSQESAVGQDEKLLQEELDIEAQQDTKAEPIDETTQNTKAESIQVAGKLTVSLNQNDKSLSAGSTFQLKASVSGYDASATGNQPQITWSSSKPDVASVSSQGMVTAKAAGNTVITATATITSAGKAYTASSSCAIKVENTVTLNKKKLTLYTCQTSKLTAKASSAVSWRSSDKSVVAVSKKGKLTPKKAGSATITATANGASASCKVTVKEPSLDLEAERTIYIKSPVNLHKEVLPEDNIDWKSSNKKIATVNSKGRVTPKKAGTVTITASCHEIKKSCKITVKKPYVKISSEKIALFAETSYTLDSSARPASKLTFRSSNPKVAKVSRKGKITGVRSGTATITASVPGANVSCEVTVLKNDCKLSRSSQTVMLGNSTTIYMSNASDAGSVSFELSDPSVAKLDADGNTCEITACQTGRTTLKAYYTTYVDGKPVTCMHSCNIKVIGSGIVQQQAAVAVNTHKALTLENVDKPNAAVTDTEWTTSNPLVASVNRHTGNVTGIKYGSAKITAIVSYSDGTTKEYVTNLKVSQPKANAKHTVVAVGHSQKISLSGLTSYSSTTWKPKKKSLISVSPDGTVTTGTKTGKTTLTIKADGQTINHTIIVTNPSMKTTSTLLAPKKTTKIKLSGICAQSNVTYHSMKKSIATVNKSGVIKGHKCGVAKINVRADGNSFTFQVEVVPQRAINACKTGYNIMYSSSYSQARRMSKGYYDCSSLVFRSYGCDTALLGGIPSWAPTAASMASYMERTGKVISYRGLSSSKLRPGDLIFYKAPYSNGRYKNIYHVSMYYGDGYRLEKPLRLYSRDRNIVMIARPVR